MLGLLPSSATALTQLALPVGSVAGLHAAGASQAAASSDLASGLPAGLRGVVGASLWQTNAARGSGVTVRSDAFVFASSGTARRVLAAWRSARHGRAVPVGQGGYVAALGRRAVIVAWRETDRIGVIALGTGRGVSDPRSRAIGYALLADGWLQSQLPNTAWGNVLDQIRPNGTVSKTTALDAFELAYGRLPGVRPPTGRRSVIASGTLAAQWTLAYWRRLTRAQRRIVERRLGVRLPASRTADVADFADPGFHQTAAVLKLANSFVPIYEAKLGHTLSLNLVAGDTTTAVPPVDGNIVLADTTTLNAEQVWGQGKPVTCRIRVTSDGQKVATADPQYYGLIIAHEVFHCFQFDITGSWLLPAAWITEGTADWAALAVDPIPYSPNGGVNLTTYINNPHKPLFQRPYDAVGFWGHSEDVVPNLFARMASILNAGSNEGSFALAGGSTDAFLTSWGSSVFRAYGKGTPWEMHSPIDPPGFAQMHGQLQTVDPSVAVFEPVDAPALTTSQYRLLTSPAEPLLHVSITGHARLGFTFNYTKLENAWFCVGGAPCVCPKGTVGDVPPTLPLDSSAALALSGDPGDGTHGELSSYKLSHFCQPKQPKPSPGHGGTGVSNGDPYITTFDGGGYGFQTAGEFTLVKSIADNLEIQSRQVPYPSTLFPSLASSLAMNTAFAMRDGGAIVEVDKGSTQVLYIDHRRRHPTSGQSIGLPGGGRVRYGTAQTIVTWRDGTTARVFSIGDEGVNIAIKPSGSRAGLLRGLLGNDNGNPSDDFVARDGHGYSAGRIESVGLFVFSPAQVRIVLGGFGRSWRITQRESLFVYPPGRSTRSYLVPGLPRSLISLLSLSLGRRRTAAAACRRAHVTNSTLLAGCTIDYGVTGDHRLASSAGTLQRAAGIPGGATSPGVSPIPWTQLSIGTDNHSPFLLPAIALANRASGTVAAAYERFGHGSIESDTFTAGTGGISAVARQTPIAGWISTGDPVLFGAPGGGLQMIFSGVHSGGLSDRLTGTLIAHRRADGSYGTPVLASPQIYVDLGAVEGAVLASDGSTPLWSTAQSGVLAVYRGASSAVANDLTAEAPGNSYDPTLAFDRSGRLWIAWYMTPTGSRQTGLYMMQLDPATGAAAGPALHVPSSDPINQLEEGRPAMACERICRVVYVQPVGPLSNLLSWAPGDSKPALVFSNADRRGGAMRGSPFTPHSPTAAYTTDGRLWVAWRDTTSYLKMYAKLGDARGAGGNLVTLQVPSRNATPQYSSSLTIGSALVLVANWAPGNLVPTSVWATVVNPG